MGVDIEIRILGPLEVRHGDEPLYVPGGRARALLALLAIRADTVVSTDRLIDQLWAESPPPTARTKLHGLVSVLRKHLAASGMREVIRTHPPGYALAVDALAVDAHRFRRMVERARESAPAEKVETLRLALDLWRGPALADFVYEPFAQAEIMTLEELRLEALEERIDADLTHGHRGDLVAELQQLVTEYPLRERLAGLLMLALYRGGRQADALAVYRQTRRFLDEELGIEPGPDLRRLEDRILTHDPALTIEAPVADTGAPGPGWLAERRKLVTVVFVELMADDAGTDAEVSRYIIDRSYRVVAEIVRRHGGTVEGLLGNVVVSVFGIPIAHEDDPGRAARATIQIRRALTDAGPVPQQTVTFRIGVNTGEVVVGDASHQPSGTTVSVASRLQQAAGDREILISGITRRILGETAVTAPGPHDAWRLVDVVDRVGGRPPPIVGRRRELQDLRKLFDRTVAQGSPGLVRVVGEAGIGKSRLVQEFTTGLREKALVLTGHCPPYGEAITFWPLREMVLEAVSQRKLGAVRELGRAAGISEQVVEQVSGAAGLFEYQGDPRQLFRAVLDFFGALSAEQPLVLVVEDLHWAEPTFRDLLFRLTQAGKGPVLIACLTRPEGMEDESGRDGMEMARIDLPPLDREEMARLVKNRAGGRRLTAGTVEQLVERTRGNPFFAEQTVAALGDDETVTIPPSIQALLAARLDHLGPAERDVARAAAVLGTEFSLAAVAALLPAAARPFLSRHLDALEEKRLVRRPQRQYLGEPALTFNHVLTQEAAYRSLTRRDRAPLHERAAAWLESTAGETSLDELAGYHLERAHADRVELGMDDDHTAELSRRAGERLGRAGLAAYGKFDVTAAENLLARAKLLLPRDHPRRYPVMRRLAETYPVMGRLDEADTAFAELLETLGPDEELARGLRLERIRIRMIAGPDPLTLETVRREAEEALATYATDGDEAGMSQACYLLAFVHLRAGRMSELEEVALEGLTHARRADLREEVGALWYVAAAMVHGPTPAPKAIAACEEFLAAHGQNHGGILSDLARLHAMAGDFDRARELVATAHDDVVERFRGVRRALTFVDQRWGQIEMLAGDSEAARWHLRWALNLAAEVGERDQIAQLAATLARMLARNGELEAAAALAEQSREQSPGESVIPQGMWRAAHGLVLAGQQQWDEARRLAQEALACLPPDMLDLRAEFFVDLAEVLALAGQPDAAASARENATALYRQKGNVAAATVIEKSCVRR